MSFTSNVKSEISKLKRSKIENIAELSAIFYSIAQIEGNIKIITENVSVAKRAFSLVKDIYDISCKIIVRKSYNFSKGYIYILEINDYKEFILSDLGIFENNNKVLIPKDYIIDDNETIKAYLRGLFLACGSISDPKKSRYHLEFVVNDEKYAEFIQKLLNVYILNSKVLIRENKYMIYIKEAEKISDFLKVIGANGGVFYFEDIRIYRDHKNMINRLNNCEQANVDKSIISSNEQIEAINMIQSINGIELLDDKLKNVAVYRLKYPDVSLSELSEIISLETGDKITKSGLYHRMKKIKEFANRIKKKQEK